MKTVLVLIICSICLWFCNSSAEHGRGSGNMASLKMDTIDFKTQVQPVLEKNCSPCHFPGGKLYEKLPFDKSETIINHKAGILKRIKNDEEVKLIRQYTAQTK